MKYLAFILSLYIFVLNLAPCQDIIVFDNGVKTAISQQVENDHQHSNQELDFCSPFCICQCCHISATYFKTINTKPDVAFISTQDFFFLNGTVKDFTSSILQPPRA